MSRIIKGLLASTAIAGVGYYLRNRRSRTLESSMPRRGVPIYDNHPIAE